MQFTLKFGFDFEFAIARATLTDNSCCELSYYARYSRLYSISARALILKVVLSSLFLELETSMI